MAPNNIAAPGKWIGAFPEVKYENKFVIKLEDDLNILIKIKNELKETIKLLEKLCTELKG